MLGLTVNVHQQPNTGQPTLTLSMRGLTLQTAKYKFLIPPFVRGHSRHRHPANRRSPAFPSPRRCSHVRFVRFTKRFPSKSAGSLFTQMLFLASASAVIHIQRATQTLPKSLLLRMLPT